MLPISAVLIRGRIPREGHFKARINSRRLRQSNAIITEERTIRNDRTQNAFFRGDVSFLHNSKRREPLALSVFRTAKGIVLTLTLRGAREDRSGQRRLYTLSGVLTAGKLEKLRAVSVPSSFLRSLTCDSSHSFVDSRHSEGDKAQNTVSANTTYKVLEISTDADSEWYATYGSESNSEILAILDAVEVIYKRDLGVEIDVVTQNVFSSSSPYTSTNASTLLPQFRDYARSNGHLGSADLFHLFTGKDLDGSVAGIAYVGVVCSSASYSYGVSQAYSRAILTQITAHELGHNFGAQHDTTSIPAGIMAPSVSGATGFSNFSIAEISTYLTQYSSCLTLRDDGASPSPSPSGSASSSPSTSPTSSSSATPSPSTPSDATPQPTAEPTLPPTPTPTPTGPEAYQGASAELTISSVTSRVFQLSAHFVTSSGDAISGIKITLYRNGKRIARRRSDAAGIALFKVRSRGTYRARMGVAGTKINSNRVRVVVG